MLDQPIRNFVVIHVTIGDTFEEASIQTYITHESHVAGFVAAQIELHHEPGVNPFNGNKTTPIWRIETAPFTACGPYWWTTPGLAREKPCTNGTILLNTQHSRRLIWEHPALAEINENLALNPD